VPGAVAAGFGAHHDPATGLEMARRGIELHSRAGERVRAVAGGKVRWIGELPGLARGVAIDHGDGYVTLTGRLGELRCAIGDEVGDGAVVGVAAGATVYLELAQGGAPIDPTQWIAPR
jgi:septal ring factor EnvC (AmiA/AmiB activator)